MKKHASAFSVVLSIASLFVNVEAPPSPMTDAQIQAALELNRPYEIFAGWFFASMLCTSMLVIAFHKRAAHIRRNALSVVREFASVARKQFQRA
jgi:hypothetical protein